MTEEEKLKHEAKIEETIVWRDEKKGPDQIGTWTVKETIPVIDKHNKKVAEHVNTSTFKNATRSQLEKNLLSRGITIRKLETQRDEALKEIKNSSDIIKHNGLSKYKTAEMVRLQKSIQALGIIESIDANKIKIAGFNRDIAVEEKMIQSRRELLDTGKTSNSEESEFKNKELEGSAEDDE